MLLPVDRIPHDLQWICIRFEAVGGDLPQEEQATYRAVGSLELYIGSNR